MFPKYIIIDNSFWRRCLDSFLPLFGYFTFRFDVVMYLIQQMKSYIRSIYILGHLRRYLRPDIYETKRSLMLNIHTSTFFDLFLTELRSRLYFPFSSYVFVLNIM